MRGNRNVNQDSSVTSSVASGPVLMIVACLPVMSRPPSLSTKQPMYCPCTTTLLASIED